MDERCATTTEAGGQGAEGAIDRELRDRLAARIRASRQHPADWWLADEAIFDGWRSGLSAARCHCGYSLDGLCAGRCPECGRVPDIGLNNVLRAMQMMAIDEDDFEHEKRLGAHERREARKVWARLVLFLRSDVADAAAVDEPLAGKWKWREAVCLAGAVACFPPFSFMLFGFAIGLLLLPLFFVFWHLSTRGHGGKPDTVAKPDDHWPFATAEDFARAKRRPRFLCGATNATA